MSQTQSTKPTCKVKTTPLRTHVQIISHLIDDFISDVMTTTLHVQQANNQDYNTGLFQNEKKI